MNANEQEIQRLAEIKWLKDNGFDPAACGIYKLSNQQLGNLTIAINAMVTRQCAKAFDSAMGR